MMTGKLKKYNLSNEEREDIIKFQQLETEIANLLNVGQGLLTVGEAFEIAVKKVFGDQVHIIGCEQTKTIH